MKPLPLDISSFPERLSFSKHIRPLYRMFMKAFKRKGDKYGARSVRRVLEEQEEDILRRVHVRNVGRLRRRLRRFEKE